MDDVFNVTESSVSMPIYLNEPESVPEDHMTFLFGVIMLMSVSIGCLLLASRVSTKKQNRVPSYRSICETNVSPSSAGSPMPPPSYQELLLNDEITLFDQYRLRDDVIAGNVYGIRCDQQSIDGSKLVIVLITLTQWWLLPMCLGMEIIWMGRNYLDGSGISSRRRIFLMELTFGG
ncbi:unnamed protein product [Anisakis simplex]|uniref:Ig-like domain-containing protein n=1 Tax=Anisakis simplex TaxID=6269 RepID=A0A0M3KFW4_ANISI|nr:unnamed protein product [Anisakis simplex]